MSERRRQARESAHIGGDIKYHRDQTPTPFSSAGARTTEQVARGKALNRRRAAIARAAMRRAEQAADPDPTHLERGDSRAVGESIRVATSVSDPPALTDVDLERVERESRELTEAYRAGTAGMEQLEPKERGARVRGRR